MLKQINNPDFDQAKSLHEFSVHSLEGNVVKLENYKGNVCVVVNTATKSPLTDSNYKAFNQFMEKYGHQGLRILAFPCNQFDHEEPGSVEEIAQHAKAYGVKFDMFHKVDVNGITASPVFKYLKNLLADKKHGSVIKGNYTKFIIDRKGIPRDRFSPLVNPMDMEKTIIALLEELPQQQQNK